MLVLTRKAGESIRIGKDIDVVVLEVSNGRIKLGFSAPQSVSVRRSELCSFDEAPVKTRSADRRRAADSAQTGLPLSQPLGREITAVVTLG